MNTTDIDLLLAEKGNPCLSMVIPTHQYTRDRMQNPELIEKAIQKARKLLSNSAWPKEKINQIENKFTVVLENIDYIRLQEGLAIFMSPNILKVHLLPFTVKEKITIGQAFDLRDLIYYAQYLRPYLLIALSKKKIRLFKGAGRDLQEVTNDDFPMTYVEEYEYARPSIGSPSSPALKSFEGDKSVIREKRLKAFLRDADETLHKYLKGNTLLLVAGVDEEVVSFEEVTGHLKRMVGKIAGNYDFDAIHPLAEMAWKNLKEHVQHSHEQLLAKLREDVGKGGLAVGLTEVWKAATEGKGLTLVVEKDYEATGYVDPVDSSQMLSRPPAQKHEIILNAPDQIMDIVREKGGKVIIVENGMLDPFDHIALRLRYP